MIMHKLVYMLLGCGFSVVILINLFRKFFSKVFRFLSAVLLLTLVCSFIAALFQWPINTLIYQLANKNIQQQLTIINCSIYLEQLSLLKNLNIFNSKPITESQINSDYYSKYLTRIQSYPKSEVSVESNLDSFIWYLLNSQLIVKSNDGYVITQLGRELLIFRIRYGLD